MTCISSCDRAPVPIIPTVILPLGEPFAIWAAPVSAAGPPWSTVSAAVRKVFGDKALVQRCTLDKRRNVADHLPDKDKAWVDAELVKAFCHPDPDQGLRNAKHLAGQLDKSYPGAAASLREGALLHAASVQQPGVKMMRRTLGNENGAVASTTMSSSLVLVRRKKFQPMPVKRFQGWSLSVLNPAG